jgi:GntR family transcriptional regulator, carbon starvation induced regulator
MTTSHRTRTSTSYERIRADITAGVLEPGSKLKVEAMGERYTVGATPLREALRRLSAEGLVLYHDQRGFSVAPLNWAELPILKTSRCDIESLALRQAIEHRTAQWEHQLVVLIHQLGRTPRSLSKRHYQPNPEWEALHSQFHSTLIAPCPSRWIKQICATMSEEAYRFRQIAAGKTFAKRNEHEEHQLIFQAAIDGKADLAVKHLVSHYSRTTTIVMQSAAKT